MAKRIGALGVDGKKMVIAYCDAGGWGQSGWTLWILRQAGIKNAKILEGGIGAWKAAGGQVTKTKNTNKAVAFTIKQYVPNYTATTEWINNNIGKPGLVILDVRTKPEFLGRSAPSRRSAPDIFPERSTSRGNHSSPPTATSNPRKRCRPFSRSTASHRIARSSSTIRLESARPSSRCSSATAAS